MGDIMEALVGGFGAGLLLTGYGHLSWTTYSNGPGILDPRHEAAIMACGYACAFTVCAMRLIQTITAIHQAMILNDFARLSGG